MYGYIYKTTNLVNAKIYIGQHHATNFDKNYYGSGKLLHRAIDKYGIKNFKCELIESCDTKEVLNERERFWISYYNSQNSDIGYNISNGGEGIVAPIPECMREHLRQVNRGKIVSEETRQKLRLAHSGSKNAWKGKKHSEETKARISNIIKEQYRNGRVNAMKGVHRYGKEAPRYGAKLSDEVKQKISNSLKGSRHTDETRRKLSENVKNRIFMNNGIVNKRVKSDEVQSYLELGYVKGRLTPWQSKH